MKPSVERHDVFLSVRFQRLRLRGFVSRMADRPEQAIPWSRIPNQAALVVGFPFPLADGTALPGGVCHMCLRHRPAFHIHDSQFQYASFLNLESHRFHAVPDLN